MNDYDNYKEFVELNEELAHKQFMDAYIDYYDRLHGYDD